jgi:hypothetical protein
MASHAKTRSQAVLSDTQLLNGIQKHFPSTTFTIQSGPQTTAQVATVLQARVDKAQAVIAAKTAYHAAVVASQQEDADSDVLVQAVRQTILTMYSTSPQILSDCGVTERKPRTPLTAEQRVIAAAKARATRAARGTMSAKKKATIKGTAPATIVVTASGSSGAPEPAATPPAAPATTTNGSSTPHA